MPVNAAFKELEKLVRQGRKDANAWQPGDGCYWIGRVDGLLRSQKLLKINHANFMKQLREVVDRFPAL